jgi:hypothetical protein
MAISYYQDKTVNVLAKIILFLAMVLFGLHVILTLNDFLYNWNARTFQKMIMEIFLTRMTPSDTNVFFCDNGYADVI